MQGERDETMKVKVENSEEYLKIVMLDGRDVERVVNINDAAHHPQRKSGKLMASVGESEEEAETLKCENHGSGWRALREG